MDGQAPGAPFDSIAHIIQTSLAPVFLLSGVATLLNTLATRLARVSDVQRHVAEQLEKTASGSDRAELLRIALKRLQQRSAIKRIYVERCTGVSLSIHCNFKTHRRSCAQ